MQNDPDTVILPTRIFTKAKMVLYQYTMIRITKCPPIEKLLIVQHGVLVKEIREHLGNFFLFALRHGLQSCTSNHTGYPNIVCD